MLDNEHLKQNFRDMIGDLTFLEAYERTGRILCITVSAMRGGRACPRLLNHLTAPHVVIWSASVASCAAPGIFSPVELKSKLAVSRIRIWSSNNLTKLRQNGSIVSFDSTPQQYLDGSYLNDLPMDELSEMFGVNFFIVSQVNPHVIPFIKGLQKRAPCGTIQESALTRFANLCQGRSYLPTTLSSYLTAR